MNAKQRNHLAMFMAVKHVFENYADVLKTIPAFEGIINAYYQLLISINQVQQVQMGNTTGSTQLKQQAEQEMIDATVKLAAAMYVYAQIEGQPDLIEKCKVSASSLEKLSAEKLKTACMLIYAEGSALGEGLVDYGQSPDDVSQLKSEIDDFAAVIAAPRSAIVTRAQARQELTHLVNEANDLLRNKVDKLIKLFESSNPKLYNTYKAARVIVDLRAGKQVVEEE